MKNKILVINTVHFFMNGISITIVRNYKLFKNDNNYAFDFVANEGIDPNFKKILTSNENNNVYIFPSRLHHMFEYRKALKNILMKNNYDIVYIHGNSSTMLLETLLTRKFTKAKIIVHAHNVDCKFRLFHKLFRNEFIKSYDCALACSKEAGDFAFGSKYKIIKNGIITSDFRFDISKRKALREKYKCEDKLVILHIGRFNKQKNQKFLIDVFNELANPNSFLIFIGKGSLYFDTLLEVKKMKLDDRILFLDETKSPQDFYNMADVFVLPSLFESFGIVAVEAQTNGLYCIVSSGVPKSIDFSNNICFLSLEKKLWVKKLNEVKIRSTSKDYVEEANCFGFNNINNRGIYSKILNCKRMNESQIRRADDKKYN